MIRAGLTDWSTDRASILLGLVLCLPCASVSLVFRMLCVFKFFCYILHCLLVRMAIGWDRQLVRSARFLRQMQETTHILCAQHADQRAHAQSMQAL